MKNTPNEAKMYLFQRERENWCVVSESEKWRTEPKRWTSLGGEAREPYEFADGDGGDDEGPLERRVHGGGAALRCCAYVSILFFVRC